MRLITPEFLLKIIERSILIVLILTLTWELFVGTWGNVFHILLTIAAISIPYQLKRLCAIDTPRMLRTGIILFVFTTMFLGELQNFYETFWWWDFVLHSVAGFGVTLIGHVVLALIYHESQQSEGPVPLLLSLFAFTLSVSVSALWEIYEFVIDSNFDTNMQPSPSDTMWDLIGATVFALLAAYIGWKWHRGAADGVMKHLLDEMFRRNHRTLR